MEERLAASRAGFSSRPVPTALLLPMILGAAVCAWAAAPAPSLELLDQAFRFASAIVSDTTDQGRAQESVVLDMAARGFLDEAVRAADTIVGWRRGTAYADLASRLAGTGRAEEARSLLEKAKQVQRTISGWQEKRIEAHVAAALAALGEVERAESIAGALAAEDVQYAGRPAAIAAPALASRGRFDEAMKRLALLADINDPDVAWWRAQGYLEVARQKALDPEGRRKAIDLARSSADAIPGWRAAQALTQVAAVQREFLSDEAARATLTAAGPILESLPATMPVTASVLADAAAEWGRAGDPGRARTLLERAAKGIPETMVIDRPAAWAAVASGHFSINDEAGARRYYDAALGEAEKLVNARPRALAVVAICREMARAGAPLTATTRARLDALRAGLKEPW